jgi:hypothetical protein
VRYNVSISRRGVSRAGLTVLTLRMWLRRSGDNQPATQGGAFSDTKKFLTGPRLQHFFDAEARGPKFPRELIRRFRDTEDTYGRAPSTQFRAFRVNASLRAGLV